MIIIMIISIIVRMLRWENHPHTIAYPSRPTFDSQEICQLRKEVAQQGDSHAVLGSTATPTVAFGKGHMEPQEKTWIEKSIFCWSSVHFS